MARSRGTATRAAAAAVLVAMVTIAGLTVRPANAQGSNNPCPAPPNYICSKLWSFPADVGTDLLPNINIEDCAAICKTMGSDCYAFAYLLGLRTCYPFGAITSKDEGGSFFLYGDVACYKQDHFLDAVDQDTYNSLLSEGVVLPCTAAAAIPVTDASASFGATTVPAPAPIATDASSAGAATAGAATAPSPSAGAYTAPTSSAGAYTAPNSPPTGY